MSLNGFKMMDAMIIPRETTLEKGKLEEVVRACMKDIQDAYNQAKNNAVGEITFVSQRIRIGGQFGVALYDGCLALKASSQVIAVIEILLDKAKIGHKPGSSKQILLINFSKKLSGLTAK